jgi:Kef-type K+ transport system membrane component KefB
VENISVIASLSVLIMVSPFCSRILDVPVSVVEIALGSIAAFLGLLSSSNEMFSSISNVGFLYLMFLAGLEVNLREFAMLKKLEWQRIAFFFLIQYSASAAIFFVFDLSPIYIAALPIVSVGMIMTMIHDFKEKKHWLSFALTLGIVGELLSICALTVLSGLTQLGGLNISFLQTMLALLVVLFAAWLFFRLTDVLFWWFPQIKKTIMPDVGTQDEDVRVSIAIFFVLIATMLRFELELVLGAFMAGMFISNFFKYKTDLSIKLSSFGFGFLVPAFFIYVGSTLDLRLLGDADILLAAAAIVCAMMLMRVAGSFLAFGKLFYAKERVLIGLSESMPLTFLVAVASIGLHSKLIDQSGYSAFILASMIEAVVIIVLIRWLLRQKRAISAYEEKRNL